MDGKGNHDPLPGLTKREVIGSKGGEGKEKALPSRFKFSVLKKG